MNNENISQKRPIPPPPPPRPANLQRPAGNGVRPNGAPIPPRPMPSTSGVTRTASIPQRPDAPKPQTMPEKQVPKPVEPIKAVPQKPQITQTKTDVKPAGTAKPVPPPPKPVKEKPAKVKKQKDPLNEQSKSILFGLLGAFFLIGGALCLAMMFFLK